MVNVASVRRLKIADLINRVNKSNRLEATFWFKYLFIYDNVSVRLLMK